MKYKNCKLLLLILLVSYLSCERNDMFILSSKAKKNPKDVQGLELWFEKNISYDPATSIVSKWTDNVYGTTLDYTQSSFPNFVTLPGGSRAIKFAGSANIEFNGTWGKTISQPYTVFTAIAIDYSQVSDTIFTGTGFYFNNIMYSTSINFNAGGTTSSWDGGSSIQNMNYYCYTLNGGNIDIYRNGNYEETLTLIGTGSITSLIFGGVNDHNFTIGSFIVYNRILTAEERDLVFFYLDVNVK